MPEMGHRHSKSAPAIESVGKEETSNSIAASGPLNHREESHVIPGENKESPTSETSRPGDLPWYSTVDEMSLAATIGAELADNFGVFSIKLDRKPSGEVSCEASNTSCKQDADHDVNTMEVPIQLAARDQRPKIHVTIPQLRPLSAVGAHRRGKKLGQQIHHTTDSSENWSSSVSPASSITQQTIECGNSTAHLSVISPISVVEMPRPQRPFSSGFSLQDAEIQMPHTAPLPTFSRSAISDSSDDTGEQDDRSSIYSLRSSMSSLASENALRRKVSEARRPSLAFSVLSPADAGVFDNIPPPPKFPKTTKSTNTLSSLVNRNKPLPPEPTTSTSTPEVAPLNLSGQSLSRTGSMKARRRVPAPLNVTKETTDKLSRRFSRAFSLRSKYTPADLDALDEAFRKTSPLKTLPSFYSAHKTQTLSQAELALEAQLLSINEDAAFIDWDVVPLVHDPLQIRRGPMHMEPSRPAPSPPTRNAPSEPAPSPRKKLQKRSPSHVALQLRAAECAMKRVSLPVVGSSLKAHRVLGTLDDMSGSPTSAMMAREASADSYWSSSESPRLYELSTGSDSALSCGGPSTPESIASSVDDAAFEEVRKRMQLLGPKHDQAETFSVYCNSDVSVSPDQLSMQQNTNRDPLEASRSGSPEKSQTNTENQSTAQRKNSGSSLSVRHASLDESHIHPLERRGRKDIKPVRSLASITMSEIPDIYASLPSPRSAIRPSMTAEEIEHAISAEAAERVLLRILQSLDNLEDLFATATVSRGFYRTFKRHELALTKGALFAMSAAAWELREMSPAYPHSNEPDSASPQSEYTPSLYLRHYMNDMYVMIHLKSMILIHCESFLRADTIAALAGAESERSSQIDNAFWRVWTFCRIFGCGKNREDDIASQIDWLKGGTLARQQNDGAKDTNNVLFSPPAAFGKGNGDGLTAEELYDMMEIWTCLGVLVRSFHGKREEAREHGIFNGTDIAAGNVEREDAMIGGLPFLQTLLLHLLTTPKEEWTHHLLTLAPSTILDVSSPTPTPSAAFAHARSRGYTAWNPPTLGSSRSTFLKEAVSRVYEEKMSQRHPSPTSASPTSPTSLDSILASAQRCAQHAVEIRARRGDPAYHGVFTSEERPMRNYPDVLHKLETAPAANSTPLVFNPTSARPALTLTVPTTIIPLPTPPHSRNSSAADKVSLPILLPTPTSLVPAGPQVRDPVDVAMERLVGMGFEEARVKKALAETDSGNSVSFEKALERLVRERKRCVTSVGGPWIM